MGEGIYALRAGCWVKKSSRELDYAGALPNLQQLFNFRCHRISIKMGRAA
jgi:hypothetical protein